MLTLHIKETLHDSLYSFYKKRAVNVVCQACNEDQEAEGEEFDEERKVPGSKSPWASTLAPYLFCNLKRFDGEGAMNPRSCEYPAEIDLYRYVDEEQEANNPAITEVLELPYKLIGVVYHDVVDDLRTGDYHAFVLREVEKESDPPAEVAGDTEAADGQAPQTPEPDQQQSSTATT